MAMTSTDLQSMLPDESGRRQLLILKVGCPIVVVAFVIVGLGMGTHVLGTSIIASPVAAPATHPGSSIQPFRPPPNASLGCTVFPTPIIAGDLSSVAPQTHLTNLSGDVVAVEYTAAEVCASPDFKKVIASWGNCSSLNSQCRNATLGFEYNSTDIEVDFIVSWNLSHNQGGFEEFWVGDVSSGVMWGPIYQSTPAISFG